MKKATYLSLIITALAIITNNAYSQSDSTNIYSSYKQSDSKYLSQFVPGSAEIITTYSADVNTKYKRNYAEYKSLLNWVVTLIETSPSFDIEIHKTWMTYYNTLVKYGEAHSDFENSKSFLTQTENDIIDIVNYYNKSLPELYNKQGIADYKLKNYNQALFEFTTSINLDSSPSTVYLNRGQVLYQLDKYAQALNDINNYIQFDGTNARAFDLRGNLKYFLKDITGSIEDFTKAIDLQSGTDLYYADRGQSKDKLNDFYGSIKDYSMAINITPDYVQAYYLRGHAEFYLKENKQALIDFNKSISLGGTDHTAYLYRGELKFNQHDYKGCIEDCSVVINTTSKAPNSYLLRGRAYFKIGKKIDACEDWSKSGEEGNTEAYELIKQFCK